MSRTCVIGGWIVGGSAVFAAVLVVGLLASGSKAGSGERPDPDRSGRPAAAAPAVVTDRIDGLPVAAASAGLVRNAAHEGNVVALTLDDGPSAEYTPQVLDLLRRYHAHATFCMIGENLDRYPDLVRQVVADGNRLCDHSMTHDEHLSSKPAPRMAWEIDQAETDLNRIAPDAPVLYYRQPGGAWSPRIQAVARRAGMVPLDWTVDPRDWSRPGTNRIIGTVEQTVRPGGVILMHDGGGPRDQTVAALNVLLPWLRDHGYAFDFPAAAPDSRPVRECQHLRAA
ncbi:MAG: polysaccharide deacetylase family protein [Mycobacteriales bacterium]